MEFLSNSFEKKTFRFYGARVLISIAIIITYLVIWRPVRVFTTEKLVYPQIQNLQAVDSNYRASMQDGAMVVDYMYHAKIKELHYRPQFGFFMLVALIALLFVATNAAPYWMLAAIHLLGSVFAYICLMAGAGGFSIGFVLVDAINGYLVPGLSLALVPLIMSGDLMSK